MNGTAPRLFRKLVQAPDLYIYGAYFQRSSFVVIENPDGTACSYHENAGPPPNVEWLETPADLLSEKDE